MKAYKAVINANTDIFKDTALTEQMSEVDSAMLKSKAASGPFQGSQRLRIQDHSDAEKYQHCCSQRVPLHFGLPFAGVCVLLPMSICMRRGCSCACIAYPEGL